METQLNKEKQIAGQKKPKSRALLIGLILIFILVFFNGCLNFFHDYRFFSLRYLLDMKKLNFIEKTLKEKHELKISNIFNNIDLKGKNFILARDGIAVFNENDLPPCYSRSLSYELNKKLRKSYDFPVLAFEEYKIALIVYDYNGFYKDYLVDYGFYGHQFCDQQPVCLNAERATIVLDDDFLGTTKYKCYRVMEK